jgi:hypothetical protein
MKEDAMKRKLVPVALELDEDAMTRFRTAARALKTSPSRLAKWILLAHLLEMQTADAERGRRPRALTW